MDDLSLSSVKPLPPQSEILTRGERDAMQSVLGSLGMLPPHEEIETLRKWVRWYEATLQALEKSVGGEQASVLPPISPDTDRLDAIRSEIARLAEGKRRDQAETEWDESYANGKAAEAFEEALEIIDRSRPFSPLTS